MFGRLIGENSEGTIQTRQLRSIHRKVLGKSIEKGTLDTLVFAAGAAAKQSFVYPPRTWDRFRDHGYQQCGRPKVQRLHA